MPIANGVKKVTYGLSELAQVRADNISEQGGGVSFDLLCAEQRQRVQLTSPGRHNVVNALAAVAAALELAVPVEKIVAGLEQFVAIGGRMDLSPLPCGGLLLDDSYNSNPLSATAALDALASLPGQGRRVAVLGDMLELGENSSQLHVDLGAKAAGVADLILAVGKYSSDLCRGAKTAGMKSEQLVELADATAAIDSLQMQQRSGDKVLVKGSRSVGLERVAEALRTATAPIMNTKQGS